MRSEAGRDAPTSDDRSALEKRLFRVLSVCLDAIHIQSSMHINSLPTHEQSGF